MKRKNLYDSYVSLNPDKTKQAPTTREQLNTLSRKKQNNCMNYLVLSNQQLEMSKTKIKNCLEKLTKRIKQPGNSQLIKNDDIIKQLEEIQKEAKNHDFSELEKKIIQAIGRRILHLEIENRRNQIQKKKIKKQEIQESFFRHKKIKKLDYQSLIKSKLNENSYIAKPYSTGKGFVQSDISYRDLDDFHLQRLQDCEFLEVIKEVNKIYMENYSHYSAHSGKSFQNNRIINIVLFFCLTLIALGILILSTKIDFIEYIMGANVTIIVIILVVHGLKTFISKPNHNNQLQQTKCDVKLFFQRKNAENKLKGRDFEWICPDDFMYIEVHFSGC